MKNNVDKYQLKGEYYQGYEKIITNLNGFYLSREFISDVKEDVFDILLRNQKQNKTLDETIGGSIEDFSINIADAYFSSISKTTFVMELLKNIFLYSWGFMLFALVMGSKIGSIGTIIMALVGAIVGVAIYLMIYKGVYKYLLNWKISALVSAVPIILFMLLKDTIYNSTKHLLISNWIIILLFIINMVGYISINYLYALKKRRG